MGDCWPTERSLPHTAAVTPESFRSCLGRCTIGTPRGELRAHVTVRPHTAAVTPESLWSCLGRGGIGSPVGVCGCAALPPSQKRWLYPSPSGLPGPPRDRGPTEGYGGLYCGTPSHTAAVTPGSCRYCLGRGGQGRMWGPRVVPPHPAQRRFNSGLPGSTRSTRG